VGSSWSIGAPSDGIFAGIGELPGDNIIIARMQPGVPTDVNIVFDVAPDATDFTIEPDND
jgi:hypothetical protein